MPLFFIAIAVTYLIANGYIYYKSWEVLQTLPLPAKWVLSILFGLGTFTILFIFGNKNLPEKGTCIHLLYEIGTGWLVFTLYMTMLLLLTNLIRVFHISFNYQFITCFSLTIILLIGGYINYIHPKTEVINIDINKHVNGNKELRIAAISDIHLGYGITKERVRELMEKVQKEEPDLILIGGDLIDSNLKPIIAQHMEDELNLLKAPLGIYMIPGNHEYFAGIGKCRQYVQEKTHIQWLQDKTITLPNGIQIIGRDDRHNFRRKSLRELTTTLNPDYPIVLLDHQPYELQQTAESGIDLQFSGHTHHGQIWPISLLTDYLFELSHGYKKIKDSHIYVSSGLSLWGPPFRIGTQSEIVIFNLKFN